MTSESDSSGSLQEFRARAEAMWGVERAGQIDEETLRKTAAAVDRMHGLSPEIGSGPGFYLGEFRGEFTGEIGQNQAVSPDEPEGGQSKSAKFSRM